MTVNKHGELFTIEELKALKKGDEVFTYFKEDGRVISGPTKVHIIDHDHVYFEDGYDFPFNCPLNTTDPVLTIQDDGDFIFKVFKVV